MTSFITLVSNDNVTFNVNPKVASMNITIKNMLEDGVFSEANQTPLTIDGVTLGKILEYCNWHYENPTVVPEVPEPKPETSSTSTPSSMPKSFEPEPQIKKRLDTDICKWDVEFLQKLNDKQLHDIILACDYLDNKPLLEIACKTVVNSLKGKNTQQIRDKYNIVNDFTKEEEQKIMDTNDWCELYHTSD